MSQIDIIAHTTPSILLMNAVCAKIGRDDLTEALRFTKKEGGGYSSLVDVKLTVNGVEIPFESTVENMWNQLSNSVDARALAKAKDIISGAGLADLFDTIRHAEWEIGRALETSLEKITQGANSEG